MDFYQILSGYVFRSYESTDSQYHCKYKTKINEKKKKQKWIAVVMLKYNVHLN